MSLSFSTFSLSLAPTSTFALSHHASIDVVTGIGNAINEGHWLKSVWQEAPILKTTE